MCTAVVLLAVGFVGFCIHRFFRKRRTKDGKKGKGVVDLKAVQLLGSAYKEKVRIYNQKAALRRSMFV